MSSISHPVATDLETISEAPTINRKISGTPEPLEPADSAQVPEPTTNRSKVSVLPRRAVTGDDYSAEQRRVYFEPSVTNRANTGDFHTSLSRLSQRGSSGLRHRSLVHEEPEDPTAYTGIPASDVVDEPRRRWSGKFSRSSTDDFHASRSPRRQSTGFTNASLPLEETEAWDKKALLSLDGGGIRGYSTLLILKELMRKIADLECSHSDPATTSFHPLSPPCQPPRSCASSNSEQSVGSEIASDWLPCHYFDYMAGTSTGGLISIMLGRLRMNIDDCIEQYAKLGDKVFGHSRWFHLRSPLWWPRDKYDHNRLRDVIQHVVDTRVPRVANFPGGRTFAYDENRCRTMVVAWQKESVKSGIEKPYIFRTYENLHQHPQILERNRNLAHDIPIWEVARATSAAPTYFEPIKIDGLEYLDGGFGANNPSNELYREVRKMHNGSTKAVRILISVGTGVNDSSTRFSDKTGLSRYLNYVNFMKKWMTDSEETHGAMKETAGKEKFNYYRLNVDCGVGDMKLDEWKTRGKLRTRLGVLIGRLRDVTAVKKNQHMSEKMIRETNADIPRIPKWFQERNKTIEAITKHTMAYLENEKVQKELDDSARLLVEARRLRVKKDINRWERTCYGAWYHCKQDQCLRGEKKYENEEALRKHFLDKHRDIFTKDPKDKEKLDHAVQEAKIIVQ